MVPHAHTATELKGVPFETLRCVAELVQVGRGHRAGGAAGEGDGHCSHVRLLRDSVGSSQTSSLARLGHNFGGENAKFPSRDLEVGKK